MTSALLVAAAVALLVPGRPVRRLRVASTPRGGPRHDPVLLVTLLVPVVCVLLLGPAAGAVTALAATPVVRAMVSRLESTGARRRRETLVAQLPTTLDLVVAVLDAGRPPSTALEVVRDAVGTPVADELGQVCSRLRVTGDPSAVWEQLAEHPQLGLLGRAFRRAETSGMPVARVVEQVAAEQRREALGLRREQARRVGVRTAAPLGLCFLPAFFCLGIVPTLVGVLGGIDLLAG